MIFRILAGLPGSGDPPEQFTYGGKGTHTEGTVVEFLPNSVDFWIGNFQPAVGTFSGVVAHPDGHHVVVVAGGQGYVIEPTTRHLVAHFGGGISGLWTVAGEGRPPRGLRRGADGRRGRDGGVGERPRAVARQGERRHQRPPAALASGRKLVAVIDALLASALAEDPALLASWKRVKRVRRIASHARNEARRPAADHHPLAAA
jgi:hypothetical protein